MYLSHQKIQVFVIQHYLVNHKQIVLFMSNNSQKRQQWSPTIMALNETKKIESAPKSNDTSQIEPKKTNENLLRRINELETELQDAINDRQRKETLLENSKKAQKILECFHEIYKKKISQLQEKVKMLESGQAESSAGDSRNKELEAQIRSLNETIDKLRKDNTRANQEIEKIQQKDFERERELDEIRRAKEELSFKLKKAETSLSNQANNSQKHQAKIENSEDKTKPLKGTVGSLKVEVKMEVVIDHSATDKLKEQKNKQRITQYRTSTSSKKEQVEKKEKKTETKLIQTTKTKQSLKQRVKDLEQAVRQLKREADSSQGQEGEETETTAKEQTLLNQKEDDDGDGHLEINNPVEKQTKKTIKANFSTEKAGTEERIKNSNSITINAEIDLDRQFI